jgi:hypothetical protein
MGTTNRRIAARLVKGREQVRGHQHLIKLPLVGSGGLGGNEIFHQAMGHG